MKPIPLSALITFSSLTLAHPIEPISKPRFEQLQKENALILVDIYAPWCSTCTTQQANLEAYQKLHPKSPLHIIKVDFDKDKDWVKTFHAPRQGTLILFKGSKQIGLTLGETRKKVLFDELDKAGGAK